MIKPYSYSDQSKLSSQPVNNFNYIVIESNERLQSHTQPSNYVLIV